ncbi:hypothetical protein [Sorangium sp. So ce385]|uniref:hypothetical protein n=1 Tax=Sorangium sp. So ce385 TaxID=3133308 RepID=UPI003F5C6824
MTAADKHPYVPPLHLLRDQLAEDVNDMARHALSAGVKLPRSVLSVLDALDEHGSRVEIARLLEAHEALTHAIAPAHPSAIRALTRRRGAAGRFLPIVGSMAAAGVIALVSFIGLSLSEYTNSSKYGNIFQASGIPLLVNELFYLSAAGLGASFAGLSKIERDLRTGTFDPRYQWAYWTRFMIGIIAGLTLATLLNVGFSPMSGTDAIASEQHLSAAALALLGGFSSSAVHRLLNRMVEAVETLLRGGIEEATAAHEQAFKARLALQELQGRMRMAASLAELQREMSRSGDVAAIAKQLDELSQTVLHGEARLSPASGERPKGSSTDANAREEAATAKAA